MKPWVVYAAFTVLSWGVWGFCSKLASNHTRAAPDFTLSSCRRRRIRSAGTGH